MSKRARRPGAIPGNRVALFCGAQCLPAFMAAIGQAQHEILLEMYWFGSDATGQRFAAALIEQARRGVRVRVTFDAIGSWEADRDMFERMRRAGCEVCEYNPVRAFRLRWQLGNRRDHRKLLLVDGCVGLTGGVNLADQWLDAAHGGGGFRDHAIRIEGPAVAAMREVFEATWRGSPLSPVPVPAAVGATAIRVLANDLLRNRRRIASAYVRAIRSARRRVWIEMSYFIPGWTLRRALVNAVRRGVDVRLLVPMVSDVPIVTFAMRRSYHDLLSRGVRLFEWSESVLHSKVAVIDDTCTIGTHNLDYRSWLYNLEVNVWVHDGEVSQQLGSVIDAAVAKSFQVDIVAWAYRPLLQRLLEALFYPLRRLM